MKKLLAFALAPLTACTIGSSGDTPDTSGDDQGGGDMSGTGGGNGNGSGGGNGMTAPTMITSDATWTGNINVNSNTTVAAGATLTIAPGTTVKFGTSGSISVLGNVTIPGTKAQIVNLQPSAAGGHYSGFSVSTGTLTMNYVVGVGGAITVDGGGTLNMTDTRMSQASHDLLVIGDGKVNVQYSAIGLDPGGASSDSTHCALHFGSNGATISITHTNISTTPTVQTAGTYGLMFYGGNNVVLTSNNWFNNVIQIDTTPGITGDVSGSWFDTAPTFNAGATVTYNSPAPMRLGDAGPR